MVKVKNLSGGMRGINVGGQPYTLFPGQEMDIDAEFGPGEEERLGQMTDIAVNDEAPSLEDGDILSSDAMSSLPEGQVIEAFGEQSVEEGRDPNAPGGLDGVNAETLQPGQTVGQQDPRVLDEQRMTQLRDVISKLNPETDFSAAGVPTVAAITANAGPWLGTISAAERDAVWAAMQAEKA